ncbi:putative extracellular nuclease [Geomicrobium halophilum]|uniref:Putative extracellular nuclease n=1 Tax=Geomicrobium halophilum TaxID=549000 RepID=A0A841PUI2_9BACL|nr:DUF6359 domain-containing protein [Geomicrobium halophilum]MBB6449961.1 putative extracellular nuclease [Geomicrobium halophilum]
MFRRSLKPSLYGVCMVALLLSVLSITGIQANASDTNDDVRTIDEAIADNEGSATIEGYIVGHTVAPSSYNFEPPFGNDYNVALADSSSETDPKRILPVQITSDFRSDYGLQTNPDLIGEKIQITGSLEPYFGVPGLQNPQDIHRENGDGKDPEPIDDLRIHDIQGADHRSPYEGEHVANVEGIVTNIDANGFYMQDPEPDEDIRTSEGIYVYEPDAHVEVGDLVYIDGVIDEYGYDDDLTTTEIEASNIDIESSGNELPEPVLIGKDGYVQPTEQIASEGLTDFDPETYGIDFYESLEGMRIQLDDPEVVGPPAYGEIPVVVDNGVDQRRTPAGGLLINEDNYNPERIFIDAEDVNAKVGDQFDGTIIGVVDYDYSNFKLRPTETLPEVQDGGTEQEVTSINPNEEDLTIASYNVENFSAETDPERTSDLAQSINENLQSPDIIGLVEVQDNNGPVDDGTTDASESYQTLIDAIKTDGGPTYDFTDIAPENNQDGGQPGGNIRVGFLYNPERVSLTDKPDGDATTAVGVDDDGLTLNPGRVDPSNEAFENSRKPLAAEFEFNDEEIVLINNHFNAKSPDDPLFGENQPPELVSEPQRIEQAEAVNDFVGDIMSMDDESNVVVMGDLNDFEFSPPLDILTNDHLTNMVTELPENERYTYIFEGNSQVLDHILVSNHLTENAEADIVNMNADFSEEDGRVSDHDPVLTQISFGETKISLPEAGLSDGSYLHEVTFELSGSDKIEYSLDQGESWKTYKEPVTITQDGETDIWYRPVDGTEEVTKTSVTVTKASIENARELTEGMDAHIGVKVSTDAQLRVADHLLNQGLDRQGYQRLDQLSQKISEYTHEEINEVDQEDLVTMLDDIVEHQR